MLSVLPLFDTFIKWAREYKSDIIGCRVGSRELVSLNSLTAIKDALEGKGNIQIAEAFAGRANSDAFINNPQKLGIISKVNNKSL